jgi:hypothetical protein
MIDARWPHSNLSTVSNIDQCLTTQWVQAKSIAAPPVVIFGDREFGNAPA